MYVVSFRTLSQLVWAGKYILTYVLLMYVSKYFIIWWKILVYLYRKLKVPVWIFALNPFFDGLNKLDHICFIVRSLDLFCFASKKPNPMEWTRLVSKKICAEKHLVSRFSFWKLWLSSIWSNFPSDQTPIHS